jgi:hypothetical protein
VRESSKIQPSALQPAFRDTWPQPLRRDLDTRGKVVDQRIGKSTKPATSIA